MRARLSHLFVHVTDLAATRRFYVDHLGLEVLMEEPGYLRVGNADGRHMGLEEVPEQGSAACLAPRPVRVPAQHLLVTGR